MQATPLSKLTLEGREFLVKRDDLFDPYLSGNKYRKLHTLLHTPKNRYKKIISYGGTQSNAMLAIAAMCQQKGWEFEYYTKPMSGVQKNQTFGNFHQALVLGMQHIEIETALYKEYIASLHVTHNEDVYIIEQGGADILAKNGIAVLAQEIREQNQDVKSIATPSGTGTTALSLALCLPEYTVYTLPCIGDEDYLKEQMLSLATIPSNLVILKPKKKYHFAKLYLEFLDMYQKTKKAGVEFDLLYAPAMWLTLLEQTQEKIIYIHSGGVSGNESMLARYSQKFTL